MRWANSAVLAVGIFLASESAVNAQTFDVEQFPQGSCVEYPSDGWCADVGLGGQAVFVFGGDGSATDSDVLLAREARLRNYGEGLETAARSVAGPQCVNEFKFVACQVWFPFCDGDNAPVKPCAEACEAVHVSCKLAFDLAKTAGFENSVPDCAAKYFDPDVTPTTVQAFGIFSLPGTWANTPVYESETYSWDPFNTGTEKTFQCNPLGGLDFSKNCNEPTCSEPFLRGRLPVLADPLKVLPGWGQPEDFDDCIDMTREYDCVKCISSCSMPCPHPIAFTEDERDSQWLSQWVPGVISIPFNFLVFSTETLKLSKMKKVGLSDRLVQFSAGIALLLAFLDSVPSMFLKQDIRCDGLDVFQPYRNIDGHAWCQIGQYKGWLLIALMATVMVNLYKVDRQLQAAISMKKYSTSKAEKIAFITVIFAIPAVLALIAGATKPDLLKHASPTYRMYHATDEMVMREDGTYEVYPSLYHANAMRGQYSCQFFFDTDLNEIVLYVLPLLAYSIGSALISFHLVILVQKMARNSSGGGGGSDGPVQKRGKGSKKKKNEAIVRLARNMMCFAAVACTLALLNITANMIYVPKAIQFGVDLDAFSSCVGTGVPPRFWNGKEMHNGTNLADKVNTDTSLDAVIKTCGDITEVSPDSGLLVLLALSQSLPLFCFGLIFALPALKQLRSVMKNKMSSVMPTSSQASSATSSD